jgi:glutathione synthase/RimK-type ligase-like ATP-grasp enzyme
MTILKTVLISTMKADFHSHCAAEAIADTGHSPILWYSEELTQKLRVSIHHPAGGGDGVIAVREDGEGIALPPDTIWMRRPQQPVVCGIHEDDMEFARIEARDFDRNLWAVIGDNALWVNQPGAARRANNKVFQLRAADRLGIRTPKSLFSNDPDEIRRFINQLGGNAIFKTYHPGFWKDDGRWASVFSSRIGLERLPSDHLLQASPGIFQEEIKKAFELRITCFGDTAVAARLNSQGSARTRTDWRADPDGVPTEPFRLPESVQEACRALMKALGLAYGAMDWIVTPEGEYVFLEVNEQGQCLWVEGYCPDVPILQCLTEFLVHGEVRSDPNVPPDRLRLEDYRKRVSERLDEDMNAKEALASASKIA